MSLRLDEVLKNLQGEEYTDKLASAEEEGRIMARGFTEEFMKQAVETDPIQVTPDHGQTPGNVNPRVQMSTAGGAVGGAASQVINSLMSRTGQNGGVIQTPAGTVAAATTTDGDTQPPADAVIARVVASQEAAAKTAAEYIVEELYNRHIGQSTGDTQEEAEKVASAQVEVIEEIAKLAEELLMEKVGESYEVDDVIEVASYLINEQLDAETQQAEKVAYFYEAGATMARGYLDTLNQG